MASQSTVEEDLEEALRLEDFDIFMELLFSECGRQLKRRIKHHGCGILSVEDVRDVFQKSMIQVNTEIRKKGFSAARPMAFVNDLVRKRAIDARRAKSRQKTKTNTDDLLPFMAESSSTGGVVSNWKLLPAEEQDFFMATLRKIVATKLPERQRIVAQAKFDNPGASWPDLIAPIAAATGERPKVSTIRSQWRNARETIVRELVRAGFDFIGRE